LCILLVLFLSLLKMHGPENARSWKCTVLKTKFRKRVKNVVSSMGIQVGIECKEVVWCGVNWRDLCEDEFKWGEVKWVKVSLGDKSTMCIRVNLSWGKLIRLWLFNLGISPTAVVVTFTVVVLTCVMCGCVLFSYLFCLYCHRVTPRTQFVRIRIRIRIRITRRIVVLCINFLPPPFSKCHFMFCTRHNMLQFMYITGVWPSLLRFSWKSQILREFYS
jgi:hypothetical protein